MTNYERYVSALEAGRRSIMRANAGAVVATVSILGAVYARTGHVPERLFEALLVFLVGLFACFISQLMDVQFASLIMKANIGLPIGRWETRTALAVDGIAGFVVTMALFLGTGLALLQLYASATG